MDRNFKASWEQNWRINVVDIYIYSNQTEERAKGDAFFLSTPPQKKAAFDSTSTHRSFMGLQAQQRFGTNWNNFHNRHCSSWSNRSINSHLQQNLVSRAFPLIPNRSIVTASGNNLFQGHGLLERHLSQQITRKNQKLPISFDSAPPVPSPTTSPIAPNKARPSQMTIFYGGRVNVFHNIPIEKAQEIMFLASNGSKISFNAVDIKTQTPPTDSEPVGRTNQIDLNQNPAGAINCKTHDSEDPPSPGSVPGSSSSIDCFAAAKGSLAPQDITLARKASLSRFLEKRKRRVSNSAPYLSGKNLTKIAEN